MINVLPALFVPKLNRFMVVGFLLLLLGFLLTPFLIGIPILAIGSALLVTGTMISFVSRFPGGSKVISEYRNLFTRMKALVIGLIRA